MVVPALWELVAIVHAQSFRNLSTCGMFQPASHTDFGGGGHGNVLQFLYGAITKALICASG